MSEDEKTPETEEGETQGDLQESEVGAGDGIADGDVQEEGLPGDED